MAYFDTTWYVNFGNGTSTGYYAVPVRPQNTAVVAGQIVRNFTAPAVGGERCWICIIAGTTANTTDATWSTTRGVGITDGTAKWAECSGMSAVNGDAINTLTYAAARLVNSVPSQGAVVKRNNGASYQMCTFSATTMPATEPAFSDTAGVTTNDGFNVWTCLGPVGNFTGGQAPHARLANALATNWFASGNTVYVGDNHAETQATSITIAGTYALMGRVLCHSAAGSYPPSTLTTGASITVTAGGNLTIRPSGPFYFYGLSFVADAISGGVVFGGSSVQGEYYLDNCALRLTSASTAYIQLGSATASAWNVVVFNNTTVRFAAVSHYILYAFAQFTWKNTGQVLASGSSVPTTLLSGGISSSGWIDSVLLEALDLSQLTGSLFANTAGASIGSLTIKDCKLNATTTLTTPINTGMTVQLAASDSSATSYKSSRITYEATETTETSIVRTGGYVDPASQAQSRKIITTANPQWLRPYAAQPLSIWNATTGSPRTVTVYGTVNAGSLPLNDEIWLDVSYLGSGTFPLGSVATSTKAKVLDAGVAVASDSSVWSGLAPTNDTFESATATNVTLSNGNLTVTSTATSSGDCGAHVMAAGGRTSGKWYFEFVMTNVSASTAGGTNKGFGVATTAATYTAMGNNGTGGVICFTSGGNVWAAGSNVGTLAVGLVTGDVGCLAADLDNRRVWFRKNGGLWNNSGSASPVTNVGGFTIPAGTIVPFITFGGTSGAAGQIFTANFGASVFTNAVPSGFADWGNNLWLPFKLTATLTPQLPGYLIPQVKVARASSTFYIDPLAVVS